MLRQINYLVCTFALLITTLTASSTWAAGIVLHKYSSELAADAVNDADLRNLLQRHRAALRSSTSFPDSGYLDDSSDWGEHTHWANYFQDYLPIVRQRCLGRYLTDNDCGRLATHFLGAVGHGLQDEVFDGFLVSRATEIDGTGQSVLDVDLESYLLYQVNLDDRRSNGVFVPAESLSAIRRANIEVNFFTALINGFIIFLGDNALHQFYPILRHTAPVSAPWAAANYQTYRGGVAFMGATTAAMYEHYWKRLNNQADPGARMTVFPNADATGVAPNLPNSETQIGAVLDRGFIPATVNETSFFVTDSEGNRVNGYFSLRSFFDRSIPRSRIIIFRPFSPLESQHTYQVTMTPEILDEDNQPLTATPLQWQFTTGEPAAF